MATCNPQCNSQEIHINDIGTVFEITLEDCDGVVDLTGVSTITFRLTDPANVRTDKTGALLTDGTDGKVIYTTVDGDLHTAGTWKLQVYVALPTGQWNSNIQKFKVHPNL